MWVKLVSVALLLASSNLDIMLLSAGTVSCISSVAGLGISLHSLMQRTMAAVQVASRTVREAKGETGLVLSTQRTLLQQL